MHINLSEMYVDDEIKNTVNNVLDSGRYIKGEQLRSFEEEFSAFCGADYGIGVSSGTSAVLLTMMALGIKEGDEVIVPSHTFIATASPAKFMGATPVYVDIDPMTYTLDPEKLESVITDNTKAIIVVHLYGHPADMDKIMSIASKYDISVIEDACQSHAAEYKGKRTGSLGNMAAFSFFPSKNMTVAGDGGMVLTSDEELATKMSMLRDHGRTDKYLHEMLGLNLRMSELPASIGRVQLKHLPEWTKARRNVAEKYTSLLKGLVETPSEKDWAKHAYYVYTIQTDDRDGLQSHLNKNGISTGIYYPVPVHRQPCMEAGVCSLSETDACVDRILSLPMHPQLSDEEIEYIAEKVQEWVK
ncbi:dTDP-4-amino-4,6-dideoxygalactose transaminase [Methanolobus vulcani]|uniref:dTDP-4-amino-4,6-dideoxygalactose transaminase n=1 Tax=Methanolobus vulcani TaxID=38026 RepID=A0A7Z7FDT0_9EURY|nr:DegT/DnrJ/EryC1/StrS family aminotransferase [Methanolobus vulcani]SDF58346.1 dTDP-4-amino-4,6-dideoxygalactose transaminase [Methanolobus vulcani]